MPPKAPSFDPYLFFAPSCLPPLLFRRSSSFFSMLPYGVCFLPIFVLFYPKGKAGDIRPWSQALVSGPLPSTPRHGCSGPSSTSQSLPFKQNKKQAGQGLPHCSHSFPACNQLLSNPYVGTALAPAAAQPQGQMAAKTKPKNKKISVKGGVHSTWSKLGLPVPSCPYWAGPALGLSNWLDLVK